MYSKEIWHPLALKFFLLSTTCIVSIGRFRSQNTEYKQFWNEVQFTHPVSPKNALELDLSSSFSNTPDDRSRLSVFTQFSGTLQFHRFTSAKWKFSLLTAYFSNSYVPEIGQREYPEIRFMVQAVYFINKIKNITLTRGRLEYRLIENTSGNFEAVPRFRQMFKFTKPLNSNYIRSGTIFAFVSEEVFLKTPTTIAGPDVFDRNMFTVAIGYAITDDLQIDLDYTNEFAPREGGNFIYNALQINIILNNPFGYIERVFRTDTKIE